MIIAGAVSNDYGGGGTLKCLHHCSGTLNYDGGDELCNGGHAGVHVNCIFANGGSHI